MACTAAALAPAAPSAGDCAGDRPLAGGAHLSLHAMPVVGAMGHYLPARRSCC